MDDHSAAFAQAGAKVRAAKGADFTVCDVEIPVRQMR